jgi:hypothetical protein
MFSIRALQQYQEKNNNELVMLITLSHDKMVK